MKAHRIYRDGHRLVVQFPYDPNLNEEVKKFKGWSFNPDSKKWTIPVDVDAEKFRSFVNDHGFALSPNLADKYKVREKEESDSVRKSKATDSSLTVPGLNPDLDLYGFQRAVVDYIVDKKKCLVAEYPGVGKTPCSIAAIQKMRAYSALCVVPSSVKLNWAKEYIKWIPNAEGHVSILDGTSLDERPPMDIRVDGRTVQVPVNDLSKPIVIMNYAILSLDVERDDGTTVPGPIMQSILQDHTFRSLVMDEAHAAKGDSLRSYACEYLADEIPVNLLLTGTPIVNKPQDLIRPLKIMGRLEDFGGWERFTRRYCNRQDAPWGIDISGAKHLDELHYNLRDMCMVRHDKEQVMPHLPDKERHYIPFALSSRAAYEKRLADFQQARKKDLEREQILGKMAKLRKELAKQKADAIIDWVKDFLETEEKLILFATHRPLQKRLLEQFDDAARIVSGDDNQQRQDNVERFQNSDDCKLIICAMGTSLTSSPGAQGHTLTAANHVAIVEPSFSPKHMEQAEDRAHREGQDNNVHIHYLVGADTIDERILEMADRRRNVADNAIDGDQDLTQEFIDSYGS